MKTYQELANIPVQNLKNSLKFDNSAFDGENKNPNWGKMFMVVDENSTEVNLKTERFFLARSRTLARSSEMIEKDGKKRAKYWCRETDDSLITVNDVDGNELVTGWYKDLKDKYKLKYNVPIYVFVESTGKVYRLVLTPCSVGNWIDFSKQLRDPHWFKIKLGEKNTGGASPFIPLDFDLDEPFPEDKAIELSMEVAKNLNQYYKEIDKPQIEGTPPPPYEEDHEEDSTDLPF